jgi:hypothetical protein
VGGWFWAGTESVPTSFCFSRKKQITGLCTSLQTFIKETKLRVRKAFWGSGYPQCAERAHCFKLLIFNLRKCTLPWKTGWTFVD